MFLPAFAAFLSTPQGWGGGVTSASVLVKGAESVFALSGRVEAICIFLSVRGLRLL